MSASGRGPGVNVPPPVYFALAYLVAWLLDRYVIHLWTPMPLATEYRVEIIGIVLILTGLSLAYWGVGTFAKLRTPVYPNRDAKLLVVQGPYRFSRNPMYTGIIIASLGGIPIIHSWWPLLTVGIAAAVVYLHVIRREERYLTEEFGDQYRDYQRQVGRWFTV